MLLDSGLGLKMTSPDAYVFATSPMLRAQRKRPFRFN